MSAIRLQTELPGPRSRELMARRAAAVPRGPYNATPIFVKEGRGARLVDVDGNELLDFAGGIGCVNVGHANAAVVEAAVRAARPAHPRLLPRHALRGLRPAGRAAERARAGRLREEDAARQLRRRGGGERGEDRARGHRPPAVIAFEDGFHGRTLLALTLTSKVHPYKAGFGPFAPEVYRAPYALLLPLPVRARAPRRARSPARTRSRTCSSATWPRRAWRR